MYAAILISLKDSFIPQSVLEIAKFEVFYLIIKISGRIRSVVLIYRTQRFIQINGTSPIDIKTGLLPANLLLAC